MKSILLVDGNQHFREEVVSFFHNDPDFSILAEAGNGYEALQMLLENTYDLIICNINLSQMNGFELMQKIKENQPFQKILILSVFDDQSTIDRVVSLGACGLISKIQSKAQLKEVLFQIVNGKTVFPNVNQVDFVENE